MGHSLDLFDWFAIHRWNPEGRFLYGLDTLGLAVFAAIGAASALDLGFGFWGTVFAGVVSGVGGGMIRDVLAGDVPGILYRSGDLYATAAAGAAATVYLTQSLHRSLVVLLGLLVGIILRVGSRITHLQLPVPRTQDPSYLRTQKEVVHSPYRAESALTLDAEGPRTTAAQ